jgi:uncharacterized protein (TIGR02118 family)
MRCCKIGSSATKDGSREIEMAKMVVIYPAPADKPAFDKHYMEVHAPLAKKLPGLKKYEVSKGKVVGAYLVATLHFDSMDAMKAAFASEAGQATGADLKNLQPAEGKIQSLMFDDQEI